MRAPKYAWSVVRVDIDSDERVPVAGVSNRPDAVATARMLELSEVGGQYYYVVEHA